MPMLYASARPRVARPSPRMTREALVEAVSPITRRPVQAVQARANAVIDQLLEGSGVNYVAFPPSAGANGRLIIQGKAASGRTFHFQITASGLSQLGVDSEAELFKKIPTLEHIDAMLRATDDTVVVTIRGIGEMAAADFNNPGAHPSRVELDPRSDEYGVRRRDHTRAAA